jgi:hypothetical protein
MFWLFLDYLFVYFSHFDIIKSCKTFFGPHQIDNFLVDLHFFDENQWKLMMKLFLRNFERKFMNYVFQEFLAYFQYAYVRALSGVRPSFLATTSHGVGRSCSFMARSIASSLWPKDLSDGRIFLGPVLAPRRRAWSPFSIVFRTFSVANQEKTEKPEYQKKTGKDGKTEKKGKTGKSRKRREKESQNIKACRIENTLKLVTPRNEFHHFLLYSLFIPRFNCSRNCDWNYKKMIFKFFHNLIFFNTQQWI